MVRVVVRVVRGIGLGEVGGFWSRVCVGRAEGKVG